MAQIHKALCRDLDKFQESTRQEYKGFTIQQSIDPWAIKYGYRFEWFIDGEKIHLCETLQDCKDEIDEKHFIYSK